MSSFAAATIAALLAAASPAAVETQIEAPGPAGPLRGTMLAPADGGRAMVLILPGSGATDRDGNSLGGVRAAPYRLLAEGLAERGIATVRIDKRGLLGSAGAIPDANQVTMADYADDVRAWVRAARERTGAPCVWVLGHSEGGLVALLAGQQSEHLCGLILVSAAGRPLGTVLREQLQSNPANAPLLGEAMPAIASLEAGRRVDTAGMHPALLPLFAAPVQGYLIDHMSYDPAQLAGTLSLPLLVVQGQRDLQVSEVDARRLADSNASARLVLIADANHVLKSVAGDDRAANAATYANPSLPLAGGIVEAIADFVAPEPVAGTE
jgi:hypothetical protein